MDFDHRLQLLAEITRPGAVQRLLPQWRLHWPDGRIKLFLTRSGLHFRRQNAALFRDGAYLPCRWRAKWRGHVRAFARSLKNNWKL